MRKIFLFMMVSLDGYFEGVNHSLAWHNVDAEFNDFAIRQLDEADTLVFGKTTYDMMAAFWTSEHARTDDPIVAGKMNSMNKIVFSRSVFSPSWEHATALTSVDPDMIRGLKEQDGKDIAILGSSNLCLSFIEHSLIDEFRIMVNPVVIGEGTPLFKGITRELPLELIDSRAFHSGNVLLRYRPKLR